MKLPSDHLILCKYVQHFPQEGIREYGFTNSLWSNNLPSRIPGTADVIAGSGEKAHVLYREITGGSTDGIDERPTSPQSSSVADSFGMEAKAKHANNFMHASRFALNMACAAADSV